LRSRIERLSRQLHAQETERREARDALRASEKAISEANRSLAALQAQERRLRDEATRHGAERRALESQLKQRQAAVARMLSARYAAGAPDAMRIALSGDDPSAVARQLHYAGHVATAAAELMASYREEIAQAQRMAREAEERRQRIAAVEQASRADRDRIVAERRERRRVLARVAAEIRSGRKQIGQLRADEARLARLVEQIGQALGRVESVPQPDGSRQPFSALRGRLRLPVAGELTARFGAPRGAAGTESKGVFIRAPEGRAVRAIARGRVVFADWMRGFGNILIVDHGEAYLSIYANNESLLKQVGDAVEPGDAVATTGASGGNEETGLYFELRHLGKAFDPLRWARLR